MDLFWHNLSCRFDYFCLSLHFEGSCRKASLCKMDRAIRAWFQSIRKKWYGVPLPALVLIFLLSNEWNHATVMVSDERYETTRYIHVISIKWICFGIICLVASIIFVFRYILRVPVEKHPSAKWTGQYVRDFSQFGRNDTVFLYRRLC